MALAESQILLKLQGHPNIVDIHDHWLEIEPEPEGDANFIVFEGQSNSDEEDELSTGPLKFYIQLEFCHINLHEWKENNFIKGIRKLDTDQVVSIALQLFSGLAYIHSKKVLHLDIKVRRKMDNEQYYFYLNHFCNYYLTRN